jgi:hypothetical protein
MNSPPGPLSLKREGECGEAFLLSIIEKCSMFNAQSSMKFSRKRPGELSPGLRPGVRIVR